MEVGFRGTRLLSSSLTVAEGSSKELVEVLGQRSSIWSFRYPAERSYGTEVSRRAMLFVLSAFGIGSREHYRRFVLCVLWPQGGLRFTGFQAWGMCRMLIRVSLQV